ncbi:hypothetical protein K504DRAFT_151107 [Pleomassaria siparia CBS 279.74]|uniref:Secreted protein n=1 Tax=Pleomassaria siparia CBS 279.74 TaxID=1314801 RepID=A0A6G1KNL1_9PLEO|nr:hypothetical protein K504DRAFT_151107 [Pleomassaria siparia CBS 279.74]
MRLQGNIIFVVLLTAPTNPIQPRYPGSPTMIRATLHFLSPMKQSLLLLLRPATATATATATAEGAFERRRKTLATLLKSSVPRARPSGC